MSPNTAIIGDWRSDLYFSSTKVSTNAREVVETAEAMEPDQPEGIVLAVGKIASDAFEHMPSIPKVQRGAKTC